MKKAFSLLLSLILFFVPAAFADENQEWQPVTFLSGAWYTDLSGVPVEMNLGEDGAYTIQIPGYVPETGTWELRDGFIYLDGSAVPEFNVMADKLLWSAAFTFFSREKTDTYLPAEVVAEIPVEIFGGYWKSVYVDVDGAAYPASALNDKTDLYVEGTSAILGGPVFHDAQVKMKNVNGALVCEVEGASVKLEIQQDGFLRLTLSFDGEGMIWYLLPAYSAALDPDAPTEPEEEPEEPEKSNTPLEDFIARCYQNALGRTGEEPEIEYWADMVRNGEQTLAEIVQGILGSQEFRSKELGNEELVSTLYRIYFNREADEAGLAAWTGMLNSGKTLEAIEEGFANSDEFKNILDAMAE